jgi:RimJ/RimL family protein N-acetyltransferase
MQQPAAPSGAIFETPRLVARRVELTDAAAMHKVYGDADAMRWVGDGEPLDLAQCEHWVEVTHRNYATRGYGMFALVSRELSSVIGFCGLVHPGGQDETELKYALCRKFWGQGFASEAAAAMLAAASSNFGRQRVIATAAPENIASHRVLLKAGMQRGPVQRNEDGSETQVFVWQVCARENAL